MLCFTVVYCHLLLALPVAPDSAADTLNSPVNATSVGITYRDIARPENTLSNRATSTRETTHSLSTSTPNEQWFDILFTNNLPTDDPVWHWHSSTRLTHCRCVWFGRVCTTNLLRLDRSSGMSSHGDASDGASPGESHCTVIVLTTADQTCRSRDQLATANDLCYSGLQSYCCSCCSLLQKTWTAGLLPPPQLPHLGSLMQ